MTCEEIRKELALGILGLGAPDKKKELELHAECCPDCARRMEKARNAYRELGVKEPSATPDWAVSWRKIEAGSMRKIRLQSLSARRRRWAFAGAVLVAVFILGAIAGRVFLVGPKSASSPALFSGIDPRAAWPGYADRLELLLVDIGNRADVERPQELVKQEKALIGRILEETRALKTILDFEDDESRLALLNEAENILAKILALRGNDKTTDEMAKGIVRSSPLKSQLQIFSPL
jgi:hypothetical protein